VEWETLSFSVALLRWILDLFSPLHVRLFPSLSFPFPSLPSLFSLLLGVSYFTTSSLCSYLSFLFLFLLLVFFNLLLHFYVCFFKKLYKIDPIFVSVVSFFSLSPPFLCSPL